MVKNYGSIEIEDNEDEVTEEIVNDNVEKIDDFTVTFNAPTFINSKLIFSASITNETGVMFNGNIQSSANVENENVDNVKLALQTIKNDTIAAMNQLDANKDWYK